MATNSGAVSNRPAPWGIEIVHFDEARKSEMYAVAGVTTDGEKIEIFLTDGTSIAYKFSEIKKILLMHSTKYDRHLEAVTGGV